METRQIDIDGEKSKCFALLAVALDPTSKLRNLDMNYVSSCCNAKSHEAKFSEISMMLGAALDNATRFWRPGNVSGLRDEQMRHTPNEEEDENGEGLPDTRERRKKHKSDSKQPSTTTKKRIAADSRAQRTVPLWYASRCALSGLICPDGAHIVPVRTLRRTQPENLWSYLGMFWPLDDIDDLVREGREISNILPLCPNSHRLWDRYMFALRPIEHPTDPRHRLYLQMVWLKDLDCEGGLVNGNWDHRRSGGIEDFRRGKDDLFPAVQHGDVYELATTDPDERPLPSLRLLEIQFRLHKLLAGMRAAGALRSVFRGDPPDEPGAIDHGVCLPPVWQFLLDAAVDEDILGIEAAAKWSRAIRMHVISTAPVV